MDKEADLVLQDLDEKEKELNKLLVCAPLNKPDLSFSKTFLIKSACICVHIFLQVSSE